MSNAVDIMSEARSASAKELPKLQMHGVDAYISEEYARAEQDKLRREVWLRVGRLEDLPEVGNYLTNDISRIRCSSCALQGMKNVGFRGPLPNPKWERCGQLPAPQSGRILRYARIQEPIVKECTV